MSKIKNSLFILIILLQSYSILFSQPGVSYESGRLIIKFAHNSDFAERWAGPERSDFLAEFDGLLGECAGKPYISASLLKAITPASPRRTFGANNPSPNTDAGADRVARERPDMDLAARIESLSRICLIEYTSPIDPAVAARKLSGYPGIEYAEPLPIRNIVGVPNDPEIDLQYYLEAIKVFEAWDYLDAGGTVVIGVVDTGVDYLHEDLADNIYVNPGEDGEDEYGVDKRTNGIDDDGNGFIDDWRGWDFAGGSGGEIGMDNDPYPGNPHGTHVAGAAAAMTDNGIGIAGVSPSAKILPVKIGYDNVLSRTVYNSYEGLLYAAAVGADVINCSWGGTNKSDAELEVVKAVAALGAVIVAAAGNNGQEGAFYPASYSKALSVAAVNLEDRKASFSNYHSSVDISAPGKDIFSTVTGGGYDFMDGTSMASPIAAGVAAMTALQYPDYIPIQIIERLKAAADNIDSVNLQYLGLIGKGRLNALNAIRDDGLRSIIINEYTIRDESGDGAIDEDEIIEMELSFLNVLRPVGDVRVEALGESWFSPEFSSSTFTLGDMGTLESKSLPMPVTFTIGKDVPLDYKMKIKILLTGSDGYESEELIEFTVRPSYRTMAANDISAAFNSAGNIGFNDYPDNLQGDGFSYENSLNILYEGALMVGVSESRVSNVARGSYQLFKDYDFFADSLFYVEYSDSLSALVGRTVYHDANDSSEAGVKVMQSVYQFDGAGRRDFIIVVYDIINNSGAYQDSLFAGLYFDWDIGPAGSNNKVFFDNDNLFGFIKHMRVDTLPWAGALLLSAQKLNYFAMDNNGGSNDNPGVWDGFFLEEKWRVLSGGIARRESNITDVSMVIGAGPMQLRDGDTTRVAFSLFAGQSLADLRAAAEASRQTAAATGLASGDYESIPKTIELINIYPNPAEDGVINIDFKLSDACEVTVDIIDVLGKKAATLMNGEYLLPDYHSVPFILPNISAGRYFLRFSAFGIVQVEPFNVIR